MKTFTLWIIWAALFTLTPILLFAIMHEQAHMVIGIGHGCQGGQIGFDNAGMYWRCENYTERSSQVIVNEAYLHGLNEVISYNLLALLATIMTTLFLFDIRPWKKT